MTESEYKEQSDRLLRYKKAQDKISATEARKEQISNGIQFIRCNHDYDVGLDYLGDNFKERLINHITSFLDLEIENIKKSIQDI